MKNKLFKPLALLIVLSVCLLAAVGCADGKRATSEELEAFRVKVLGKKGELTKVSPENSLLSSSITTLRYASGIAKP